MNQHQANREWFLTLQDLQERSIDASILLQKKRSNGARAILAQCRADLLFFLQQLPESESLSAPKVLLEDPRPFVNGYSLCNLEQQVIDFQQILEKVRSEICPEALPISNYLRRLFRYFLSIMLVATLSYVWIVQSRHGLTIELFNGNAPIGKPFYTGRIRRIYFDSNERFEIPQTKSTTTFSARISGYIFAEKSGTYQIITKNDDGIRLWINQQLVIDDWINHPEQFQRANIELAQGWHEITIEYFQEDGDYSLKLFWAPPNKKAYSVSGNELLPSLASTEGSPVSEVKKPEAVQ